MLPQHTINEKTVAFCTADCAQTAAVNASAEKRYLQAITILLPVEFRTPVAYSDEGCFILMPSYPALHVDADWTGQTGV